MSKTATSSKPCPDEDTETSFDELLKMLPRRHTIQTDKVNEAAFRRIFDEEAMKSDLVAEVSELTDHALAIDASFRNASAQLGELLKCSGPYEAEILGRKAEWDKKREDYIELLWKSRNTAVKARAAAEDFAGSFIVMLKDPDTPMLTKKEEIKRYKHKLNDDRKEAEKVSQEFTMLREWVEDFMHEFTAMGNKIKATQEDEKIRKLDVIISQLEALFTRIEQKLNEFLLALQVNLGISGASLLAFICPHSWTKAAVAASDELAKSTPLAKYRAKLASLEMEVKSKRAERAQLRTSNKPAIAVQGALRAIEQEAKGIASKLEAFSYVWAVIVADLGDIETKMDLIEDTEYYKLFEIRLETVAVLYRSLSLALYQYATTVSKGSQFVNRA